MKKTLKNLVMATLMSGAMAVSNPIYSQNSETQKQETPKEQKLSPHLNFYFETGEYLLNRDAPEFKKYIKAWLCACPKEDNKGFIFFNYGDTDDNGFYDYVLIDKMDDQIRSKEKFYFNLDTKEINYTLDIYEFCPKIISDCEKIINKSYNGINQKESYQIGEDFNERIKKFLSVQKGFSRFNPESLEKLVREEYKHKLKLVDGKLVGNSETPIEKFLSEEEIKKVEDYYKEKPERERIKREQEERVKALKIEQEKIAEAEYERVEKIRREEEEKKRIENQPKASLKIGGLIGKISPAYDADESFSFEINPAITFGNKEMKNKIGFDITYGSIKIRDYADKIEYGVLGVGLNLGTISPSSNIEYDYLNILFSNYTINKNDKDKTFISYGTNRKYHQKQQSFLVGQKLGFFPFKDSKNLSFSLEAGAILYATFILDFGFEGRVGAGYTFGKKIPSKQK